MLQKAGITGAPFWERPARPGEPEIHPNGQPWAWVYRSLIELEADEASALFPTEKQALHSAALEAMARASSKMEHTHAQPTYSH